uniref:DDE Tnp4 domain-containing protein n=1 Tax=Cyprinus carpio TaxID=7962 RepID=A0A8C2IPC7_CYPCA
DFLTQFNTLKELNTPIIQRKNTNYRDCISVGEHLMITLRFLATGESFKSLSYQFRVGMSTIHETYQNDYDNYRFLYADVGCNGRVSDGGVFGGCSLQDALEKRTSNIPAPAPLPESDQLAPYCTVADEAFPLKEYLMKPYPNHRLSVEQRIFSYWLSRARRVVENAFGILANRFRVFLTTINIQNSAKVLACCALHNFLRTECCEAYMPAIDQEGLDQDPGLQQASLPHTTNSTTHAKQLRDKLCQYFNSDIGTVPFQWGKI